MSFGLGQIVFAIIVAGWVVRIVWHLVTSNVGARWMAAEGQPDLKEAVAAFKKREWQALVRLYEDRPPSDRYHFLRGLGSLTKLDSALPQNPRGTLATIAAGVCLAWAWRHRGAGMGADVSEQKVLEMTRLLVEAEALLAGLGEQMDSVGCAIAIRVEMGLAGSRGPLQRALNNAVSGSEHNIFVALNHLTFVAPKWHGSIDELTEVAREYAARPHPAWMAMIAVADAEIWLYEEVMSPDVSARDRATAYFLGPKFRAELESLDDRFWHAVMAGSVTMTHAEAVIAHNALAYLLMRTSLNGRLARHMDRLGRDITEQPWGYLGYPRSPGGVREIRAQAGLPPL